ASGHRRIEEHTIAAVDAILAGSTTTPSKRKQTRAGGRHLVADQVIRLVKEGVIRGHISRVGGILIDDSKAAIATRKGRPRTSAVLVGRAVVLSAADGEVAIRGMQGQTLKLNRVERRVIQAGPIDAGIC